MKLNKLAILISIALMATLILVIIVRENQHDKTIAEYLDREILKEEDRLETYREFTKNYNEFQDNYDELYKKYEEHYIEWHDNFIITRYTQQDEGCNNITSIGLNLDKAWTQYFNFVAVDPDVIPYGKTVYIKDGDEIIEALAVDTGGKIRGNNIDFYSNNLKEAFNWGVRELEVGWVK